MKRPPTFRNSPLKCVRFGASSDESRIDWLVEPTVAAYRHFEHNAGDKTIPVPVCATPAAVEGVGAIVAGFDGRVSLIDSSLEKVYWRLRFSHPIYASPIFAPDGASVIVADTGGVVARISLRGSVLWRVDLGFPIYATPDLLDGAERLAVVCFGGRLVLLSLDTGVASAQAELDQPWFYAAAPATAGREPYSSPAALPSGHVAVGAGAAVTMFDADAFPIWRRELTSLMRASLAFCPRTQVIVAAGVNGVVSLLDARTGEWLSALTLDGKVTASPAVSDGVAAVGTASGAVYGLDLDRRQVLWRESYGAPFDHSAFTTLPNGDFICTHGGGNVIARARLDGRFVWETSQRIGQQGHGTRVDITPVCGADGVMYCGAYNGALYAYRFRAAK
jgi:outer membrane protein assembly factor BamB